MQHVFSLDGGSLSKLDLDHDKFLDFDLDVGSLFKLNLDHDSGSLSKLNLDHDSGSLFKLNLDHDLDKFLDGGSLIKFNLDLDKFLSATTSHCDDDRAPWRGTRTDGT